MFLENSRRNFGPDYFRKMSIYMFDKKLMYASALQETTTFQKYIIK